MLHQRFVPFLVVGAAVAVICGGISQGGPGAAAEKAKDKAAPKDVKPAERFKAPKGLLESLPAARATKAAKAAPTPSGGYLFYMNNAVNYPGGCTLNGSEGSTQISVYASHISWRYAVNSEDVVSPTGDGGPAGGGWQYPNANRFGIVIYQGGNYWNVTSTDPNNPTVITGISNTTPVGVAVNDTTGNYGDNWGSFDLYLRRDN